MGEVQYNSICFIGTKASYNNIKTKKSGILAHLSSQLLEVRVRVALSLKLAWYIELLSGQLELYRQTLSSKINKQK